METKQNLLISFTIVTAPQFILVFIDPQFLVGGGCFLLLIFWALCLSIGLAIAESRQKKALAYLCVAGTALISLMFWSLPDKQVSIAVNKAGMQIRSEISEDMKIIGITFAAYGVDFTSLF